MRDRILEVATAHFVDRGFDGVSMREIAADCGITKAALYYHFSGKTELLNEIFTDYLDQTGEVVASSVAGQGSVEDRLKTLVRGLFELPSRRRAIMRLAIHDVGRLPQQQQAAFGSAYRQQFLTPIRDLVSAGIAAGELVEIDPDFCVKLLLGMVYPFFAPTASEVETSEIDTLLHVLFGGLRRR
jgi:AcrR family transcriptional regulator